MLLCPWKWDWTRIGHDWWRKSWWWTFWRSHGRHRRLDQLQWVILSYCCVLKVWQKFTTQAARINNTICSPCTLRRLLYAFTATRCWRSVPSCHGSVILFVWFIRAVWLALVCVCERSLGICFSAQRYIVPSSHDLVVDLCQNRHQQFGKGYRVLLASFPIHATAWCNIAAFKLALLVSLAALKNVCNPTVLVSRAVVTMIERSWNCVSSSEKPSAIAGWSTNGDTTDVQLGSPPWITGKTRTTMHSIYHRCSPLRRLQLLDGNGQTSRRSEVQKSWFDGITNDREDDETNTSFMGRRDCLQVDTLLVGFMSWMTIIQTSELLLLTAKPVYRLEWNRIFRSLRHAWLSKHSGRGPSFSSFSTTSHTKTWLLFWEQTNLLTSEAKTSSSLLLRDEQVKSAFTSHKNLSFCWILCPEWATVSWISHWAAWQRCCLLDQNAHQVKRPTFSFRRRFWSPVSYLLNPLDTDQRQGPDIRAISYRVSATSKQYWAARYQHQVSINDLRKVISLFEILELVSYCGHDEFDYCCAWSIETPLRHYSQFPSRISWVHFGSENQLPNRDVLVRSWPQTRTKMTVQQPSGTAPSSGRLDFICCY